VHDARLLQIMDLNETDTILPLFSAGSKMENADFVEKWALSCYTGLIMNAEFGGLKS